jgi:hypothetical protein
VVSYVEGESCEGNSAISENVISLTVVSLVTVHPENVIERCLVCYGNEVKCIISFCKNK